MQVPVGRQTAEPFEPSDQLGRRFKRCSKFLLPFLSRFSTEKGPHPQTLDNLKSFPQSQMRAPLGVKFQNDTDYNAMVLWKKNAHGKSSMHHHQTLEEGEETIGTASLLPNPQSIPRKRLQSRAGA